MSWGKLHYFDNFAQFSCSAESKIAPEHNTYTSMPDRKYSVLSFFLHVISNLLDSFGEGDFVLHGSLWQSVTHLTENSDTCVPVAYKSWPTYFVVVFFLLHYIWSPGPILSQQRMTVWVLETTIAETLYLQATDCTDDLGISSCFEMAPKTFLICVNLLCAFSFLYWSPWT